MQVKFRPHRPKSIPVPSAATVRTASTRHNAANHASLGLTPKPMTLRLFRFSFWFAAALAAWTLLMPGRFDTVLTTIVMLSSAVAYVSWRAAVRARLVTAATDYLPLTPPALDRSALDEVALRMGASLEQAQGFEAALHLAARTLRNELGATQVTVHAVLARGEDTALMAELVAQAPGFRTAAQSQRLGTGALGTALRLVQPVLDLPRAAVLPVPGGPAGVHAVLEWRGLMLAIDAPALERLMLTVQAQLCLAAPGATAVATVVSSPSRRPVPAADRPANFGQGATPQRLPAKLLLVDDNGRSESTAQLLRRLGSRVFLASGMLQGLHSLRDSHFDALLIGMPLAGLTSAEGLMSFRQGRRPSERAVASGRLPVIALSEGCSSADGTRFRDLGFDEHLGSPPGLEQMMAALKRQLAHCAPWEREASASAPRPAEPVVQSAAVLDPAALQRLAELDPQGKNQLVVRVLKAFQSSAARLRPQADAAHAGADHATLKLVAHTLKSSSASIGAARLSSHCAQLEAALRDGHLEQLDDKVQSMNESLDAALSAIAALLEAQS
jgi:HPt (histidine-containing phosphotransfer) domain-containing protein/CheY-like chemotaxis protein